MVPLFLSVQSVRRVKFSLHSRCLSLAILPVALAAILSLAFSAQGLLAESIDRPNIIYIMADDMGYGDPGCFGQQQIQTPRLDRLAAEGMRLTSYYAGCTVCRPSRLVLWTGKHAGHTAINSNAGYVFQPSDITVAELLQGAGNAPGGGGKRATGGVGT
ncbi:MAG: sulfatase-like hydrolase/transferase, partial [Planctomycetes bacterium]|nr:sulfatase-like hydrolase/transferase [Planctomycetota bacterium]